MGESEEKIKKLEKKLLDLEIKAAKKLAAIAGTLYVGPKQIIVTKISKWLEKKPLKDF